MAERVYDLLVLGAGPGGYVAAIRAAELGFNVVVVDERPQPGGVCLHEGCIPSKALLESSALFLQARQGLEEHGIEMAPATLNLAKMMARKDRIVHGLGDGVSLLFKKNHITHVVGRGSLLQADAGGHRVEVVNAEGTTQLNAKRILLATGSQPRQADALPVDGERIVTSREALCLPQVPNHLLVVGAGIIGLEIGSLWQRLGARVTVLGKYDQIVPRTEAALAGDLQQLLQQQGMEFVLKSRVEGVERCATGLKVQLVTAADEHQTIECDGVLVAIGRQPNHTAMGLDAVGLTPAANGFLDVDDDFQTAVPGIYALGDLVAGPMLAHKASTEAVVFAERLVGRQSSIDYSLVPKVVYSHPELAIVGRSASELQQADIAFVAGRVPFLANGRAHCQGDVAGYIEVLAAPNDGRLLGVAILGRMASELINEATSVMAFGGSVLDVALCCHAHPSLSEAFKDVAHTLRQQLEKR